MNTYKITNTENYEVALSTNGRYGYFEHNELGDICGGGLSTEAESLYFSINGFSLVLPPPSPVTSVCTLPWFNGEFPKSIPFNLNGVFIILFLKYYVINSKLEIVPFTIPVFIIFSLKEVS